MLVDTEVLRRGQHKDPCLEKVRVRLPHGKVTTDPEEKLDTETYLLDDRDMMWFDCSRERKARVVDPLRVCARSFLSNSCHARPPRRSLYSFPATRALSLADNHAERTGIRRVKPVLKMKSLDKPESR